MHIETYNKLFPDYPPGSEIEGETIRQNARFICNLAIDDGYAKLNSNIYEYIINLSKKEKTFLDWLSNYRTFVVMRSGDDIYFRYLEQDFLHLAEQSIIINIKEVKNDN